MKPQVERIYCGFILLFLLAAALSLAAPSVWAGPVVDQYFPINNGDNRSYQSHKTPSDKTTEYFSQTIFNGNSVFSLYFHDEWHTSMGTGTWYLGKSSTALMLYGITTDWGTLSLNSPANVMTDQSINNNQTITTNVKGVQNGSSFDVTVQATIFPLGTLTVPAGTFSNCKLLLVVETTSVFGVPFQNYDSAAWILAPGVGIIVDGGATWDYNTKQFSAFDLFGNPQDFYELVSGTVNGVSIGSAGYVPPNDNYTYTTYNGKITITGYTGSGGAVTIPNTIDGLPVTSIGNSIGGFPFSHCTSLTSVTIPNSVITIDKMAFYGCTSLTSVTMGDSVTGIGSSAFQYCTSLTSVTLPSSITGIGLDAFSDCTKLAAVYFKGNAPTYYFDGIASFRNDDNLTIYYLAGTTGWGTTYGGHAAMLWIPQPPDTTAPASPTTLTAVGNANSISLAWQDNANNEQGFKIDRKVGAVGTWEMYTTVGANVTTFNDTSVVAGITYYYRVYAYNTSGLSPYSNEAAAALTPILSIPASPTALTAVGNANSIILAWPDNSYNEQGFKIDRKVGAGGIWIQYGLVGANIMAFNDTGVATGNTYYYRVYAYNTSGISLYSNEASAALVGGDGNDTATTATAVNNGQTVNAAITPVGDVDWYKFTVGVNGGSGAVIETDGASGDTELWLYGPNSSTTQVAYDDDTGNGNFSRISVSSLAAGTYYAKVSDYGNDGTIAAYTFKATWTDGGGGGSVPASPTGLTAAGAANSIGLAWTDNANNEQGFKIDRKVGAGGTWVIYTTVGANVTTFNDTSVVAGTTYYYRVYAYNSTGLSAYYSNDASAALPVIGSVPASPTGLTAAGAANSIGLAWTDNANNEQGFKIDRKVGAVGTWVIYATVGANITTFNDTSVVAGNTYYYRVYAYNTFGISLYSNEAYGLPGPIPPSPTTLTAVGNANSISLAWRDNANNEQGFKIDRKVGAGGTWVIYMTAGANVTTFNDTSVVAGNTYYYRVYAYNTFGISLYSNEASTGVPGPIPTSPTTLTAVGNANSISLAWRDNANNEQGFKIDRKVGAVGTWVIYATVGANITTFNDTSVVAGNTYYYRVYAYNTFGISLYSNEAAAALTVSNVATHSAEQGAIRTMAEGTAILTTALPQNGRPTIVITGLQDPNVLVEMSTDLIHWNLWTNWTINAAQEIVIEPPNEDLPQCFFRTRSNQSPQ